MTSRSRAVLAAIQRLGTQNTRVVANRIAREAAKDDPAILEPVRRHGRGAVAKSWSGTAADCHRILGSLGALRRAGYIAPVYERGYATTYVITEKGEAELADPAAAYSYAAADVYAVALDTVYPIDEEHRYRVYARQGNDLEVLCAAPTPEGMGAALVQLDRDAAEHGRRLVDHGAIGVLDVLDRRWIVMPWHRPEGKTRIRETEVIL